MGLRRLSSARRLRDGRRGSAALECRGSAALECRGSAALEFGLVAPVFMTMLCAVIGIGVDGYFQATLDMAVRGAARQLQINGPAATGPAGFITAVCSLFGTVAPDCSKHLTFSIKASTPQAGFRALTVDPLSGGVLNNGFFSGAAFAPGTPVLVQVAYPLPFVIPFVGSVITWTGANTLLSVAAVQAEPFK